MTSQSRILVTGASGFVGAQIVDNLLNAGYAVRGVCRSNKEETLRNNCSHSKFEVTVVDDLISGDFSEALRDISAVIHVASPMIGRENPVEVAIGGTMNIIRQAYDAEVFKVTLLGSFAALFTSAEEVSDGSRILTDQDWRKVTKDDLMPDSPAVKVYAASKTLAERAAWEFSESHSKLDLITILPPFIFGPLAPAQVISDAAGLSTNGWLYQLVSRPIPTYPAALARHAVDVRDVAKAAVVSLSAVKRHPGEQRRILLYGGSFTWKEVVRHLGDVRPELRRRLVDGGDPDADLGGTKAVAGLDTSKTTEILGLSAFIGWKQMVEDAMDSMLQKEAAWEV